METCLRQTPRSLAQAPEWTSVPVIGHLIAVLAILDPWLAKLPPYLSEGLCTSVSTQVGLGSGYSCSTGAGSTAAGGGGG